MGYLETMYYPFVKPLVSRPFFESLSSLSLATLCLGHVIRDFSLKELSFLLSMSLVTIL